MPVFAPCFLVPSPIFSRRPLALVVAAAALLLSAAVQAEEQAVVQLKTVSVVEDGLPGETENSGSYTTDSMRTSTPLNLSIKETPQSVSVVTRQRIDDQAMQSITDVINNVIGVSSKAFDTSRNGFSARGFDITNLMVDGVPTTWSAGWSAGETQTDLVIFDRVEVVRGATGLVTGAGNPSAAINMVRKHATSREFTGWVQASAGTWSNYRGIADVTMPLTENGSVRARFVASWQEQDSFRDFYEDERQVYYGVVDADLTENTLFSIGASQQKNDPSGSIWGGLPTWFSDGARTDWSRSATTAAKWSTWGSTQETAFASLEHTFANDWKARIGYTNGQNDGKLRLLFLSGYPDHVTGLGMSASPAYYDTERKQDTYDVSLSGPLELLGRVHEIAIGYVQLEQDFISNSRPRVATTPGSIFAWNGSYPEPVWGALYRYETTTTEQTGYYAAGRFQLTDALKLIAGARVAGWETDTVGLYIRPATFEYNDEVLPYLGLVYDVTANVSAYASYTDIFNAQNYRDTSGSYLDPVTGETYEMGLKGEYFDGRLNASLSVFDIRQDNLAQPDPIGVVPGTNPPVQAYYGADGTESKGFEVELSGEVATGWNISVGWSQFTAEDASGEDVNTRFPRRQFKLFTNYRLPGDWTRLVVGGGVNWESSNYTLAAGPAVFGGVTQKVSQDSYALANLMARYEFTDQFSAQLNVNNLFDEKYYAQIGFYGQLQHGDPRNAQVSLKYQF